MVLHRRLLLALAVTSCATGGTAPTSDGGFSDVVLTGDGAPSAKCDGGICDADGDGVSDTNDKCPNTPAKAVVNKVGCSDAQLTAKLEPTFPPYGLTWNETGALGRAGGLTWTYSGIQRRP